MWLYVRAHRVRTYVRTVVRIFMRACVRTHVHASVQIIIIYMWYAGPAVMESLKSLKLLYAYTLALRFTNVRMYERTYMRTK